MKKRSILRRYMGKRTQKVGLPPETLVYVGDKASGMPARITVIEFSEDDFSERVVAHPQELLPLKPAPITTWINVDALSDPALLASFGEMFHLHPLLMEDILNTFQRPKCEYSDEMLYVILKMFDYDLQRQEVMSEQMSLVLGERFLLTFQEKVGDELEGIRERLRANGLRIRAGGAGYLLYAILDQVVDRYFLVLEKIGQTLDDIEERLSDEDPPNVLSTVHHIKRELIFLRKNIWPVREVFNTLQHADSRLLAREHQMFLRDVYDHTIQAMDTLETYRDLLAGIQDLYLSVLSNRMNEIMKVLTIISTLFIPLTFIVGVYGMNFRYMPELSMPWAYPVVWGVMLGIVVAMLFFFRRRRWI